MSWIWKFCLFTYFFHLKMGLIAGDELSIKTKLKNDSNKQKKVKGHIKKTMKHVHFSECLGFGNFICSHIFSPENGPHSWRWVINRNEIQLPTAWEPIQRTHVEVYDFYIPSVRDQSWVVMEDAKLTASDALAYF